MSDRDHEYLGEEEKDDEDVSDTESDVSDTKSDYDEFEVKEEGSSLRDIASGTVSFFQETVGPALGDAAKSVVYNPVTRAMGRSAKYVFASAAGRNKIRPMSYNEIDVILQKYQRSYDLSSYQRYATQAAGKLQSVVKMPTITDDDGNKSLDLSKFGKAGSDFKAKAATNEENKERLKQLQAYLGTLEPQGLHEEDGIISKYLALHDEMQAAGDNYHTPHQIAAAFGALKERAITQIDTGKKEAINKVNSLIHKTVRDDGSFDLDNLTDEQTAFAELCEINVTEAGAHDKLSKKLNDLIKHTEKTYDDARKNLNDFFTGTPERKEGDTTVPKVTGLDEKIQNERARVENDLLNRAIQLEKMESRGYKIPRAIDDDLVAHSGDLEETREDRERALQGKSLTDLQRIKWAGNIRDRELGDIKTRSGGKITFEMKDGKFSATHLKVPPRCYFLTEEAYFERMQLDAEEFISHVKGQKDPGAPLALTIDHEVDEYRRELVLATYKAARKNGYEPSEITFTVTGSTDEKQQFSGKPALEVLEKMGLGNDDTVKQDLQSFNQQKSGISKKRQDRAEKSIKSAINILRQSEDSKTKPEVSTDSDPEPPTTTLRK